MIVGSISKIILLGTSGNHLYNHLGNFREPLAPEAFWNTRLLCWSYWEPKKNPLIPLESSG